MRFVDTLTDLLREGAADAFGFNDIAAENEQLRDRFMEANADARLLSRKLEDAGFWNLGDQNASPVFSELTPQQRLDEIKRNYKYWLYDPVVKRTIELRAFYTFSREWGKPKYRENQDGDSTDEALGQQYIDRFWFDYDNQRAITDHAVLVMREIELQVQGELFFLMFRDNERADQADPDEPQNEWDARPATLKVTDLPGHEIQEIVTHPGNRKVPVFYKRTYRPRVFNFNEGKYETADKEETVYYRDWRHEAPTEWQGKPWGPKPEQIGEGVVMHVTRNKTSEMKRGIPDVNAYIKWAQGLNEYMTSRMATVQAIAQIALRAKTRGGPRHVSQVSAALADISKLATNIEGATSLERNPAETGRTKVAVENQGVELQPMIQDTNAGGASIDISTFKGQVAAGSGVGVQHLGDSIGAANLASATSMDAPLLRLIQFTQSQWKGVLSKMLGYMLQGVGLDPSRADVQPSPILERDVALINATLSTMLTTVDPQLGNAEFIRYYVGEVLDAMGKTNASELVDKFFPEGWQTPQDQAAEAEAAAAAAAVAQQAAANGEDPAAAAATAEAVANDQYIDDNLHRRRSAEERGGPGEAGLESRDRAGLRYERRAAQNVEALVEADREALGPPANGHVPDLAPIAEAALAVLDEDDELTEPSDGD